MLAKKWVPVMWAGALAALASLASVPARAEFPERPINFIVGSGAGGAVDTYARLIGSYMEKKWGQPVVVLNTPGAGGAVAATQLREKAADGYTIAISNSEVYSATPLLADKSRYTIDDFTYLSGVSQGRCAWVTNAASPYKTMQDVIDAGKKKVPITFGALTPLNRLVAEFVAQKAGIQFNVATFPGVGEIMQAVLGQHVDIGVSGGTHLPYMNAGQMRVLAYTTPTNTGTDGIKTLAEMGYGISTCTFFMVAAPKGMPKPEQAKLAAMIQEALKTPEAATYMTAQAQELLLLGPVELEARVRADEADYKRVLGK